MIPILEEITPETAARIVEQARAKGLSVDEYLKNLLRATNEAPEAAAPPRILSMEEKEKLWLDWVNNHAVQGVIADDDRQSIYSREDRVL